MMLGNWNGLPEGHSSVIDRIRECRKGIGTWRRANNTNSAKRIKELIPIIDKAHTDQVTTSEQIQELRLDLLKAYREEETYWKLKSRNQWMQEGDGNTRFFHAAAKNRVSCNRVVTIQDEDGNDIYGNIEIADEAQRYFKALFTKGDQADLSRIMQHVKLVITEEANETLLREVTQEEVQAALFLIGATKAPGPDELTAIFYQTYWNTVGSAITHEVQQFFKTGVMPRDWNHTNLCLIPKIKQPKTMKDFRPISLCNVTYKIISKILKMRLKSALGMAISEQQAAFLPGCHITDNVLVTHEVLHALRVRKRCANSYMAVKTDISKAYDRIEWNFLEAVLRKKGFAEQWITWIMECVKSVSFSV